MKEVLLIGGPFDGQVTDVTDDLPPYWRVVHRTAPLTIVRGPRKAHGPEPMLSFEAALYRREVIHGWSTPTKVNFYEFVEVEK